MILACEGEHSSRWAAVQSIAGKIGCTAQTLHTWISRHEVDMGMRDGITAPWVLDGAMNGALFETYVEQELAQR